MSPCARSLSPGPSHIRLVGGVRIGLCAMTTRGLDEDDCRVVASLLDRVCTEALRVQGMVSRANALPSRRALLEVFCPCPCPCPCPCLALALALPLPCSALPCRALLCSALPCHGGQRCGIPLRGPDLQAFIHLGLPVMPCHVLPAAKGGLHVIAIASCRWAKSLLTSTRPLTTAP